MLQAFSQTSTPPSYGLQTLPFEDYKGPNWVEDMKT